MKWFRYSLISVLVFMSLGCGSGQVDDFNGNPSAEEDSKEETETPQNY